MKLVKQLVQSLKWENQSIISQNQKKEHEIPTFLPKWLDFQR